MARFKSTITDRGAEVLTAFLAAGKRLVLVSAAAGDGVAQVSPNTLTALVNPINVNAQIGEKTFVESNPSYMRIPVQVTNAGLEAAQYVREVATFALDEKDAPFMFSYSWLDGADSDNILPPDSFLGRAGMDGEGDTVHIHDVAVVVTNQENSGITVEVGNGSFVTTAQMVAYSAPIVHGHAASDVQESTGESVESVQRRQDFDISAIREQLDLLPRKEITEKSLSHSRIIVLKDKQEVIDFTNLYAPEHLIIQTTDYIDIAGQIENAGSVFMGPYTPESAGDYASGTNHTLPTNGYAKAYSGVNLDSFIKKITFQEITADGIKQLGGTIQTMAANEQLDAHKNAVTIRLNTL